MRTLMVALIVTLLSVVASGQESTRPERIQGIDDPPAEVGQAVSIRAIKELPPLDKSPKITLQRALRIAERFVKKQKLDIKGCYLYRAKLGLAPTDADTAEPRWQFLWVRLRGGGVPKKDVWVAVSMDGIAQLLDSP